MNCAGVRKDKMPNYVCKKCREQQPPQTEPDRLEQEQHNSKESDCFKCKKSIQDLNTIKCIGCSNEFHRVKGCAGGLSKQQNPKDWKCNDCKLNLFDSIKIDITKRFTRSNVMFVSNIIVNNIL